MEESVEKWAESLQNLEKKIMGIYMTYNYRLELTGVGWHGYWQKTSSEGRLCEKKNHGGEEKEKTITKNENVISTLSFFVKILKRFL